jgi:hypothetical protein
MKRKFITGVIVVSIIICAVAFGYIISNLLTKDNINKTNTKQNEQSTDNTTTQNNVTTTTTTSENIVLDSKIGTEILNILRVPNIYSEKYYSILDSSGLSNDTKRFFAFMKIYMDSNYSNLLRSSENYVGSYITAKDLENVAKNLFYNTTSINHGEVFGESSYDKENQNYIIVPMGFAGGNFNYVVEVPYEMKEYTDRIEVSMYKLYITRMSDEESLDSNSENIIYYDSARQNKGFSISDVDMYDEESQISIIKRYIDNGSIKKDKLEKTVYEIKKDGAYYKISGYKTVK